MNDIIVLFVVLLLAGLVIGAIAEKCHYTSIRRREKKLRSIILVQSKLIPRNQPCRTAFVCGIVVVGMDFFKMVVASFQNLLGGRIGAYETLVERARREAILRMKEDAARNHGHYIFNVKFSTANVEGQKRRRAGCVEVIAYGTAVLPLIQPFDDL